MASYTSIGDSYQAAISCYKNFSWGYKTSKTILMRFHPSQEPSEKTKHPSPTSHIGICQVVKEVKTRVVATSRWGCQWVGCWNLPDLLCQLHFSKSSSAIKKWLLKWEKGKTPPFLWRLGISFALDHEKPTIPPGQHQHRPRNWAYFAFPSDFHANSCDWRFSSLGRMLSWRNYPPKDHLGENSEFPYQIPWWLFSIPEMIFFKCPVFWVFLQKCTIKIVIGMPTLEITSVETDTCIHIKYKYMDMH